MQDRIPPKWFKAIEALLANPSPVSAATLAGTTPRTIRRWLRTQRFQELYVKAASEMFKVTLAGAQSMVDGAMRALGRLMETSDSDKIKLDAANAIVEHGFKAAELGNLAARVAAMEAILAAKSQEGPSVPSLMERLNGLPLPNGKNGTNGNGKH